MIRRSPAVLAVLAATLAVAALAPAARAQGPRPDHSAAVRAALERLPITAGTWEGEAWYRQGPGEPQAISQVEKVESRLDGVVLLLEGVGRGADGAVVHHAFATLGWRPDTQQYTLTAWVADGNVVEAETSFADGVLTWGFQAPNGPRFRYHIEGPEPGVWKESGEASMDGGATWHPFFGMTLRRTGGPEG